MKVAWLCPYPLQMIENIPGRFRNRQDHSSTWIVNLSRGISRFFPEIELHIITETASVAKSCVVCENGLIYHILRSRSSIPFTLRGFPGFLPLDVFSLFVLNRFLLVKEVKKIKPDVVHAHGTEAAYGLAAVTCGYPSIVSVQGIIGELAKQRRNQRYAIVKHLEKFTIKKGKYFIAKSAFARNFVQCVHPSATIFDIENPVQELFFCVRRSDMSDRVVLFIGSVVREKGIEELLEAFTKVNNGKLKIIGNGGKSYIEYLRKKAGALGIADRVEWRGHRSPVEIATEFERAGVLVLPSYMETSPNTVSEAMCAGVPVIATKVGGIPDMVSHEKTGLLVDSRNVDQLAFAIDHILDNREMASRLAQAARQEAIIRFSARKSAEKTIAAYKEILAVSRN